MGAIDEIYKEYINMRQHGLDSREALRALRGYIDPLPQRSKEQLAGQFRGWEQQNRSSTPKLQKPARPATKPPQAPKQLKRQPVPPKQQPVPPPTTDELNEAIQRTTKTNPPAKPRERPDDGLPDAVYGGNNYNWDEEVRDPSQPTDDDVWVSCSYCGHKNRVRDIFCYSCGHMLDDVVDRFDTRHFNSATGELFDDDYFGEDSVMILSVRSGQEDGRFELRPQLNTREVVVGRSAENQTVRPDVDLSHVGAAELGVSRLHLAITYDRDNESIQVKDLGSANGTYVNAQKLLPTEIRAIRNGDEIRLARLTLRVRFQHPGHPRD